MIPLLQDEISRKDKIDVALKIQHNMCLPIARIPPEILSEIFLHHRDANNSSIRGYEDRTSWMFVANVSSHWRSVALSSPRLWSTFNLSFPRLVEHSLRYVGSTTPLHVEFSNPTKGLSNVNSEPLALVLTRICNTTNPIIVVELRARGHTIKLLLAPILARSAHQLVVLRLELNGFTLLDTMARLDPSIPNLQILSLKCDMRSLDCVLMRSCAGSLRELTLGRCHFGDSLQAIAALPSFPKLEKLYLEDCFGADLNRHEEITISLPARLS
uniref:F-box-like domain-containing protein n=1 Tax=Aetokthonos hydrillicola TaxID=1550245 RepID=UPI001ABB04F3